MAADEALALEDGEHVVAVASLRSRDEGLEAVVEAEEPEQVTDENDDEAPATLTGKVYDTDVVLVRTDDLRDIIVDPNDEDFNPDPEVKWTRPRVVHDDIQDNDGNGRIEKDRADEMKNQFMPAKASQWFRPSMSHSLCISRRSSAPALPSSIQWALLPTQYLTPEMLPSPVYFSGDLL